MKKTMTEKKTTISSLSHQDWIKVKVKTKKVNKVLPNIPTGNIAELNEQIYAVTELACDEIGVPRRNANKNTKHGKWH